MEEKAQVPILATLLLLYQAKSNHTFVAQHVNYLRSQLSENPPPQIGGLGSKLTLPITVIASMQTGAEHDNKLPGRLTPWALIRGGIAHNADLDSSADEALAILIIFRFILHFQEQKTPIAHFSNALRTGHQLRHARGNYNSCKFLLQSTRLRAYLFEKMQPQQTYRVQAWRSCSNALRHYQTRPHIQLPTPPVKMPGLPCNSDVTVQRMFAHIDKAMGVMYHELAGVFMICCRASDLSVCSYLSGHLYCMVLLRGIDPYGHRAYETTRLNAPREDPEGLVLAQRGCHYEKLVEHVKESPFHLFCSVISVYCVNLVKDAAFRVPLPVVVNLSYRAFELASKPDIKPTSDLRNAYFNRAEDRPDSAYRINCLFLPDPYTHSLNGSGYLFACPTSERASSRVDSRISVRLLSPYAQPCIGHGHTGWVYTDWFGDTCAALRLVRICVCAVASGRCISGPSMPLRLFPATRPNGCWSLIEPHARDVDQSCYNHMTPKKETCIFGRWMCCISCLTIWACGLRHSEGLQVEELNPPKSHFDPKSTFNSIMPASGIITPPKLFCVEPSCELTTFTTRSNLNRHSLSKHGLKVHMPCGREQQNHKSNIERHKKSCQRCRAALSQALTLDGRHGSGSPRSATTCATEMSNFARSLQNYPEDLNGMINFMDDYSLGAFQ
ncbi:uncharacterized protein CLUP02_03141 [Colletotrichum lupini]|uniref:Uncharacterized protein n=1 Tax=Colletotrichum lupini TaxID=145971 RepID=A0A9Q8SHX6_9PEZI|nr:uncharacterized protein CLUP02_03141 [Colletotrichum lupini]UQC77671.1 hypothetical protein CLUP02_03141 [Colletotrichum lupini]